jgi:cell division septation protein DedD
MNNFREVLDECLERIRQGDTVDSCLAAHPEHATQLAPLLRSAFVMRKLELPQPGAASIAKARNKLLERVAEGSGKEAVMRGMFKLSPAMVAAAAVFVMSLGLVAAAGAGVLTGGGSNGVTFNARVVSTASTLFFVQREDDQSYVYLVFNNNSRFEDESGSAIGWSGIPRNSRVLVEATPPASGRFFDTQLVRMIGTASTPTSAPTPEPTPAPTAEPTSEPTKAAEPEPTHKPEPTKAPEPTKTPKPAEAVQEAVEFWGTVTGIGEGHLAVNRENATPVTVWINGETAYPNGFPFVGVKVWVFAYKNGDGTFTAKKVTNKIAEFAGVVAAANGCSSFTISVSGANKTVLANEHTSFPQGCPVVGDEVGVLAYHMGDGTYLAKKIEVHADQPSVFEGVVIKNLTAEWTLKVQVGAEYKIVCYEFASNAADLQAMGDSLVGKTVRVHVSSFDGSTHFAGLVEVLN